MKKLRDNNFQENSTKESTLIRFNKISNTKIIQRKDKYQIGIITNMPGLKDKDKAVDSRKWIWVQNNKAAKILSTIIDVTDENF